MENTTMPNAVRRLLVIFGALLLLSLLASGFSAVYVTLAAPQRSTYVPTTIGFEGQLADAQGVPVADGNYEITFNLYNAPTGGSAIWTEPQSSVQVKDGLYSVQLGSVISFNAEAFSGPRWLGVTVGGEEMEPRIPVSAVPFALNAKYAQGLQDKMVATVEPETSDTLIYTGTQWEPKGMTFPNLAPVGSNASPNDLLANYRSGAILRWKANDTVEVSAGELMINGFMRRNTSAVDVKFDEDAGGNGPNRGLDTGTEGPNETYYIYAVAYDPENTFDLIISTNATNPTGVTNYRKLGSFKTESTSANIVQGSAANVIDTPYFAPSAKVYNSSDISVPNGIWTVVTFNSEHWDNDNIHSMSGNTSRLTARTAGKYLIFAQVDAGAVNWGIRLQIKLNSSTIIANEGYSDTGLRAITTIYNLGVGDYVELYAYQSIGYASPIYAISDYSPKFMLIKLSD